MGMSILRPALCSAALWTAIAPALAQTATPPGTDLPGTDAPATDAPAASRPGAPDTAPPPDREAPTAPSPDGAAPTAPSPAGRPDGALPAAGEARGATAPPATSSRATPHGARRLSGVVRDALTGEPVVDATIATADRRRRVRSDRLGRFELPLRPGRHDLRVECPLYEPREIRGVLVADPDAGGAPLEVTLVPAAGAENEVVVVEGRVDLQSESAALETRRRSVVVADVLSAREISRTPDSSASDAVKRVVGATLVDGRYLGVRGLSGRYVNVLLHGVVLPSPEPDRQEVPLDLLPTGLLGNLALSKSYDAGEPATFAGGTLQLETSAHPDALTASIKLGVGAGSESHLAPVQSYQGGSTDLLGFDGGTRQLPAAVPRDRAVRGGAGGLERSQIAGIARSFDNTWAVQERQALPNLGLGAQLGDALRIAGQRVAYLASAGYRRDESARREQIGRVSRSDSGQVAYRERLQAEEGSASAQLSGLLSLGWRGRGRSELDLVSLYTHSGEQSAARVTGLSESDGLDIDSSRLLFVERQLWFNQLVGRHRLGAGERIRVDWQVNASLVNRDEPDTRDLTYHQLTSGALRFKSETGSGERFFSELDEQSLGAALAVGGGAGRLRLRAGASLQNTERSFSARRFRHAFVGRDLSFLERPPQTLFAADSLGSAFALEERTLASDAHQAALLVTAGHASAELALSERLRAVTGLRLESAAQTVHSGSRFAADAGAVAPADVDRTSTSLAPTSNLVYALNQRMNLRAAYSLTVARPRFRELAPFLYFDYTRRRSVSGNPALEESRVHNADLRWEWFPADDEVFALSLFAKEFRQPIEQVIISASGGDVSYANAEAARCVGGEFEARLGLGRLGPALAALRLQSSLALIHSRVTLSAAQQMSQTSRSRPLQGQSPYVANLGLGYQPGAGSELALLYNVSGARIDEVGFETLPDVLERPFHRLDLAASTRLPHQLRLKLTARNLLDAASVQTQGGLEVSRYKPGVSVSATVEWRPR
jgi:hypothetical protein